jgi:hypothetical protein
MSLETLKNLPLINNQTQPLSDSARTFYLSTFAGGNGPTGTYLLTDFLGTAIGVTAGQYFQSTASIISANTATLATLDSIYGVILGVIQGTYGDPVTGPVVIPVGNPGAGTYSDANDALAVLIPLANAAIVTAQTALGTSATTLNNDWNAICARIVYEATNQSKASLQMYNLISGDKLSVMALTTSLNSIGQETQEGMGAQFFEAITDTSTSAGQAIIGAMREGRNNAALDAAPVARDNTVPLTQATPPQAQLGNSEYTVAEARALNQA